MTVIHSTILLTRRIADLQRRREALVEKQERLRRSLPHWALAPLQLVGMTEGEIRTAMTDLTRAEQDAGLDEIEGRIDELDERIEELENQMLTSPSQSLDGIRATLELALDRFRRQTPTDPADVFYDYGDARVLAFLERASDDLRDLLSDGQRAAS